MGAFRKLAQRARSLFRKRAVDADLEKELRLHLELETENNIRAGLSADEARRRARIAFGSVEAAKEHHRDGRGTRWIEDFGADVRYGLRTLRRAPSLAIAAIITLALGIGANTAIFSAVNAVILRPLPFADPKRLVMLWESNPDRGWVEQTAAPANMLDWREQVHAFEDVGGYASFTNSATLTGAGEPKKLSSVQVTGSLFSVLGVTPAAGQLFRDEQTWSSAELTVMLSHRTWREMFGSDPSLPGRTIELNGRPVRVVGVLPESFAIPGLDVDIWRPTGFDRAQRSQAGFRRAHWLHVVGRLRPGTDANQANAELQTVIKRLEQDFPATNTHMGGGFSPLQDFLIGETRRPLLVLLGAVGLLLLIACANVGNLLLVHAASRGRESAVRLALGASRARLVRQALTESVVLSAIGGTAGFVLGWWSTHLLAALRPAGLLPTREIAMSWTVLAYVTALTTVSGLLFGVAPAMWQRDRAPGDAIREGGRTGSGVRARRWGEILLISEVAIALLLTTGAGLLLRSLWNLQRVDAGIDSRGVLTASIALPGIRYDSVRKVTAFWDAVTERSRAIPGVTAVGAVTALPLTVPSWSSDLTAEGWTADRFVVEVRHRNVSPGYFSAMGVRLLRGRFIDETDRLGGTPVVVINDAIASKYFRGEDPIGRRITFNRVADSTAFWRTVVGVVGSERQANLSVPPAPEVFAPTLQAADCCLTLVVRTTGAPAAIAPALRQAVASIDPNLAVADVRTMDDIRVDAAARERFMTILLLAFAVVGVMLAVVGVYGVMAHVARGRMREMGIRIALGARAGEVRGLVIRRGLLLTSVGVAIGLVGALAATKALKTVLYGVGPTDPVTFVAVPLLLGAAAVVACWIPAARAGRADPVSRFTGSD